KITAHNRPITGTRDAVACRRKFRAGHLSFHCLSRARKRRGAAPTTASAILVKYRKLEESRYTSQAKFPLASRKLSSPPPTAAAPHLARAAAIEIIKHRGDAAAVPVARDEPDPLTRRPSQAGRRPCREPRAVDDEIAAVRGLHDFDHVLLGRQIEPV